MANEGNNDNNNRVEGLPSVMIAEDESVSPDQLDVTEGSVEDPTQGWAQQVEDAEQGNVTKDSRSAETVKLESYTEVDPEQGGDAVEAHTTDAPISFDAEEVEQKSGGKLLSFIGGAALAVGTYFGAQFATEPERVAEEKATAAAIEAKVEKAHADGVKEATTAAMEADVADKIARAGQVVSLQEHMHAFVPLDCDKDCGISSSFNAAHRDCIGDDKTAHWGVDFKGLVDGREAERVVCESLAVRKPSGLSPAGGGT